MIWTTTECFLCIWPRKCKRRRKGQNSVRLVYLHAFHYKQWQHQRVNFGWEFVLRDKASSVATTQLEDSFELKALFNAIQYIIIKKFTSF